jgi:hypothetical protein
VARALPACDSLATSANTKTAAGIPSGGRPGIKRLLNTDADARQVYADGGAINHRRWSVIRCSVNHRRRSTIPAAMPIAMMVATTMIIPMVFRVGRCEGHPQHEQR